MRALPEPRLIATCVVVAALAATPAGQRIDEIVPVGVRHALDADAGRRRTDLEEFRRLRFNVVALSPESTTDMELGLIERLLGGAADARVHAAGVATISEKESGSAAQVRLAAWYYLSMGARGIIFGDWTALSRNPDALTAAVEFADHITRNVALYAPLRPRLSRAEAPDVTVSGNDPSITARLLESHDALLLVAINHDAAQPREVTLTFSEAMPEAIWQNMLTGAAVNFVAGPTGPVYTRTFPPRDVLVLMIRKRWK